MPQGGAPMPPMAAPWQPTDPAPQAALPEPHAGPAIAAHRQLRGFLFSFHSDPAGVFWPLYLGRNILGRAGSGEPLDIEITDPTTSSRHAIVVCEDGGAVSLEDEASTNGTFVNDNAIGYRGRSELRDGDRVRFGAYNAGIRLVSR